ncbi:MAG: TetR/AcrR family transcriptional regulator [Aliidongia sp.]
MASAPKRIRRTAEDARRQILDAAEARLARIGPAGIKLQDVAADLGISHPVILHHFGSREGLIRALTNRAMVELKDRLMLALHATEVKTENILGEVFNAFRGGLAQRLAWLAVSGSGSGEDNGQQDIVTLEIVRTVHEMRMAKTPPGTAIDEEDTKSIVYLVTAAAFGDAIFGAQLRKRAGLPDDSGANSGFQLWFAELLRRHLDEIARVTPPRPPHGEIPATVPRLRTRSRPPGNSA